MQLPLLYPTKVESRYGNKEFDADYNPQDQRTIYNRLKELVSNKEITGDHATRLVQGFQRYGSWKEYHVDWALFHITKHEHPERFHQGNHAQANVTGMASILAHLVAATNTLRRPVIQLEVNDQTVVLKLNTGGKRPGTVAVSSSSKFGEGDFYGYINLEGEFEPRPAVRQTVIEILQHVATNPARVISEIGRQSGRCCYCPAKLSQVQSKIAGCGKTCADNYGIDYPNAERTRLVLIENPDHLVGATDATRWA